MKEYFVKTLKDEGDIESGDRFFDTLNGVFDIADWTSDLEKLNAVTPGGSRIYPRVILALCTRDIQVGDDYTVEDVSGRLSTYQCIKRDGERVYYGDITYDMAGFKIIGEISPNATWVKDCDTFDETTARLAGFLKSENSEYGWFNNSFVPYTEEELKSYDKWKNFVVIKCPTCKRFH